MNGSSNSCLMMTATVPIAPPRASDPTSPMKTSAGCALYQRNPMDDPTIAPQKMVNSATCGMRCRSEERRVGKECRYRCDWSSDVCSSDLMKTSAGCALYQRNPMDDPTIAPQKMVNSATCGMRC